MKPKIAFITICLFYTVSVLAQDWDYPYTQFTKNDGLPSNTIYCITSDKNGILWMGTDAGVVRYDGNSFKVYNTDNGLPSNDVFEIVCDSKNRLWLTTFKNDITYIYQGKIHTRKDDTLLNKINNRFSNPRYFEDSEQNLWIRTIKFELFKIDQNDKVDLIKFYFNPTEAGYNLTEYQKKIFFVSRLNAFYYDLVSKEVCLISSKKNIYIEGLKVYNNICYYIIDNSVLRRSDSSLLTSGIFKSLSSYWNIPIIDSNLWVPSQNGFILYSLSKLNFTKRILSDMAVSTCHKDSIGNVWISTISNGLFKLNSSVVINYCEGNKSANIIFTAVYLDNKNIYAGTNKGDLYIFDRKSSSLLSIFPIRVNGISNNRVLKIIKEKNNLYIATDRGILQKDLLKNTDNWFPMDNTALKNFFIEKGKIITLDNVGVSYIPRNPEDTSLVIFKRFYSYCDYKDKKVVGSQDSLYYIDKTFKPYPLNIHFNYRAVDLVVKDSILIATTAEKGVFFIHDSVVVKNFNSSNGFSSNTCYKSVIYKDELFTATNRGINIYNFKTDSLFHLYESDGLPSNTVFDLKIFNDTIYAATEAGLSIIPVSEIPHTRTFPLFANPIIVHKDTVWNLPKHVEVYTDQQITFVLNALSYGTKTPVKYHYKIVGLDTNYKSTTDQNLLVSNLSYGQYWLDAFAINTEGVRSEQLMISITIKPYFYQTRTFKTILTCFLLIVLAIFTKWVVNKSRRKEKRKNALEKKLLGFELNAWKTAINPHFLFNSLNAIQSLFQHNDLTRVNTYIKKFSSVLRKTIDQSALLLVSIHEEINYLQIYLELEKIKRGKDFDYQITCESNTLATNMIPSLVIQNIVENSLKHGIQDNKYGNVQIHFKKQNNRIHCTIQDNGAGFQEGEPIKEESKGLQLVKNKLSLVEKLINDKIKFSFTNRLNDAHQIIGAETTFIFPIITLDYELQSDNH